MVFLSVLTWVAHLFILLMSCEYQLSHLQFMFLTFSPFIYIYIDSCMCFVPLLYLLCT